MNTLLQHNELTATVGSYLAMDSFSVLFSLVLVPIVNLIALKYINGNVLNVSLVQQVTQVILILKPIGILMAFGAIILFILWLFNILGKLQSGTEPISIELQPVLAYLYQISGLNNEKLLETVLSSPSNSLIALIVIIEATSAFFLPYLQVIQMNSSSPFKNTSLTQIYKYTPAVITCGVFVYNTVVYILLDQSLIRNIFIATVSFIFYVDPSLIALEFI